jgi:MFS family permease
VLHIPRQTFLGLLCVAVVFMALATPLSARASDRFGRKPVLIASLLIMGIATMSIGALPTYQSVGVLAPILLVAIRLIQGLAFGAEWGGAVLMAYEHAPWRRRGFFAGIPMAGAPFGVGLASVTFLASTALPGDWAWRVPFLAYAILIIVGMIIRFSVSESPEFEEIKATGEVVKNPFFTVVRKDWRNILRIIALRLVESCGYYVTATYVLTYVTSNHLADRSIALTGQILGSFLAIAMILFFGSRTDRWGRKPIYLVACIATIIHAFLVFVMVNTGVDFVVVMAFVISIGLIWAAFAGVQAAWFVELFSTNVRCSGASTGYQVAAALSGFSPFIAALLAKNYGWHGPAAFLAVIGVIGLLGTISTRETWGKKERAEVQNYIEGRPTAEADMAGAC